MAGRSNARNGPPDRAAGAASAAVGAADRAGAAASTRAIAASDDRKAAEDRAAVTQTDDRGAIDYLLLGHVTVDRVDDRRMVLGGTATYAALAARNMGARVGVHTSTSYEPGLIDVLNGVLVARIPAEYTSCFVNDYSSGK